MKKIIVPSDFLYKTDKIQQTAKFGQFLINNTLTDPRFGQSYELVKMNLKLKKEAAELQANQEWLISEKECAILQEITLNPSKPYDTSLVSQFITFLDAIMEAQDASVAPIAKTAEAALTRAGASLKIKTRPRRSKH